MNKGILRERVLSYSSLDKLGAGEITSPQIMVRKGELNEDSLFSQKVFGYTVQEKKIKPGFVKLNKMYINPIIYDSFFRRRFRKIDSIISNSKKYIIDAKGNLIEDEKGNSGIVWFKDNIENINFLKNIEEGEEDTSSITSRELVKSFLAMVKNKTAFVDFMPIVPVYLRDINREDIDRLRLDEVNAMYQKVISLNEMYKKGSNNVLIDKGNLDLRIQHALNDVYNYFMDKIFGKDGLQRKKIMSKTPEFSARTVISAHIPTGGFGTSKIDMDTMGIPLSAAIGTFKLHMLYMLHRLLDTFFLKGYFGKEITRDTFEFYFDRKMLSELIDKYIKSVGERFEYIYIIGEDGEKSFLEIEVQPDGQDTFIKRITLVELMYMAAKLKIEDEGYNVLNRRYPIMDKHHLFTQGLHILSTIKTIKCRVDGMMFDNYPNVFTKDLLQYKDLDSIPMSDDYATQFHETSKISSTLLKRMNADFDGDKIATTGIYTKKNNRIAKDSRNKVAYLLATNGSLLNFVGGEPIQCLYSLTKDYQSTKVVDREYVELLLNTEVKDMNPTWLLRNLRMADTLKTKRINHYGDIVQLKAGDIPGLKGAVNTTLGRLIVYKVIFMHLNNALYFKTDEALNNKVIIGMFNNLKQECIDGKITVEQLKYTIKLYEDFGFRMSTYINPSIDSRVFASTPKTDKRRDELLAEHKDELEKGNVIVADNIKKELIGIAKDELKGNTYLDWYESGATKKVTYDSDFASAKIMVGAIPTGELGDYTIVTSNFIDGIKKSEIHKMATVGTTAAFLRAENTAIGGALAKEGNQTLESVKADSMSSDCGTKDFIYVDLGSVSDPNAYDGAYTPDNRRLDKEQIKKLIESGNGVIKLRSPMNCKGNNICGHCMGESIYKYTSNEKAEVVYVGFETPKMLTELTQASLQKSHVIGANTKSLTDINKYIFKI